MGVDRDAPVRELRHNRAVRSIFSMISVAWCIAGCQGEQVEAAPANTGGSETAMGEVGSVTAVGDAADASSDECDPPGNLVSQSELTSGGVGWWTDNASFSTGEGPCGGKSVVVKTTAGFGSVGKRVDRISSKGARGRLRAWFQMTPKSVAAPSLAVRAIRASDGGEVIVDLSNTYADATAVGWKAVETTFTLGEAAVGFSVVVVSRASTSEEFGLSGVSLTVE